MRKEDLQSKEYREAFVSAMTSTDLAFQIRAIRENRSWSQHDLAAKMGTPQNVISRYENPDYDGFTLKTLERIAAAFDVALIVKFVSFDEARNMDRSRDAVIPPFT